MNVEDKISFFNIKFSDLTHLTIIPPIFRIGISQIPICVHLGIYQELPADMKYTEECMSNTKLLCEQPVPLWFFHRPVDDALKNVRIFCKSLIFRPKGPGHPWVLMTDFLTVKFFK